MARRGFFYRDFLPVVVIIGNECSDVGLLTLFKAATLQGMNNHVFVAYAYVVATIVLLPVTLFTRRTRVVPPLSFSIISKIVLLGAIGSSSQLLGFAGVDSSSPTLASSIGNLVPAFTFMLAVTFRSMASLIKLNEKEMVLNDSPRGQPLEKSSETLRTTDTAPQKHKLTVLLILTAEVTVSAVRTTRTVSFYFLGMMSVVISVSDDFSSTSPRGPPILEPTLNYMMEKLATKSRSSQAKVTGSIISIAGAFVLTFYKGPSIINAHDHVSSPPLQQPVGFLKSEDASWAIAGILLTADYFLVSLWFILQVNILEEFPDELTLVLFSNVTATIISTAVGLLAVPNAIDWKIGLDLSLISIVSSGILGKLMSNVVHAWSLRLKGAVFVTSFKPLQIVISVAMGVMFLGDTLHVGSIIGATIISIGLYAVLWGKVKEEIEEDVGILESQTTENAPLLQSYRIETFDKKIAGNV